jgi:phospho-N-acetylmuramoyl-pentapeptide-transferase
MLYSLLFPLHTTYSAFNVLRYITFRTVMAALTALNNLRLRNAVFRRQIEKEWRRFRIW